MSEQPSTDRDRALARLRRWHDKTLNPLYAWEAILRCLRNDDAGAIPDWCLRYMRGVAENLYELSCGQDFKPGSERISPKAAIERVPEALSLSKRGKRNAFASLLKDRQLMRWGLDAEYYGKEVAAGRVMKTRSISPGRADRVVAQGRRLVGYGAKPKR